MPARRAHPHCRRRPPLVRLHASLSPTSPQPQAGARRPAKPDLAALEREARCCGWRCSSVRCLPLPTSARSSNAFSPSTPPPSPPGCCPRLAPPPSPLGSSSGPGLWWRRPCSRTAPSAEEEGVETRGRGWTTT
ncbi:hypothetical protein BS78_01G404700 [Paspalum vaginatum]|nr:hypothetical protein BS78_01G404700 [Paspalum vaginatum]